MAYKILVKYASRERPKKFFEGMDSLYNNLYDTENIGVLITCDTNDDSMFDRKVIDRINEYRNAHVIFGSSKSKIDAINRDMDILPEQFKDWDIIICFSDDQRMTFFGWDIVVRNAFEDGNLDKLIHRVASNTTEITSLYTTLYFVIMK